MSVILDALRRARGVGDRQPTPAAPPAGATGPRTVPAGLGLGPTPGGAPRPRAPWVRWAGAALLVVLTAWAVVRFVPRGGESGAPASLTTPIAQPAPQPAIMAPEVPAATTPQEAPEGASSVAPRAPSARSRVRRAGTQNRGPSAQSPAPSAEGPAPRAESPEPRAQGPEPRVDHFALAVRYQNLGDFEQALKHYLAVLAEDEFNVEARNNLGLLYHGRGLTSDAIDQFRRAILINPRYIKARSNLAVVLTSAGRLAEARAELRAALAIEPRNVDLVVNMALVDKADRRPEQAMELLVRAVGDRPDHAAAHYNLAVLYEERGSLALAYDHYHAFLKYAGPEHGPLLTDVRQRAELIEPRLSRARPSP